MNRERKTSKSVDLADKTKVHETPAEKLSFHVSLSGISKICLT